MIILLAKTAGFCMGVRRAVELVLDAPANHEEPICTYGPLIHNPQVLALFKEKGISVLKDIPEKASGTVLIRAHGIPPQEKRRLRESGLKVIDATCPRVIKVQTIIRKHARKGYASIILGDKNHPEVRGLLGYAGENGHVVGDLVALQKLPAFKDAIVVAQTTQNTRMFRQVVQWVSQAYPHYKIFETICDSTERRQDEVQRLAESVDAVVVVGGRNSGNTRRLAQIARQAGKPAYHIETEADLDLDTLGSAERIGITAGASTPHWITKRVYRKLELLPFNSGQGLRRALFALQRTLLLTNIYVALGAGCLCYASLRLQGLDQLFPHVWIAILYVLSMHILNHLTGTRADRYNDPERATFYRRYRYLLTALAVTAGGSGLLMAYTLGWLPFALLLCMSLLGLSYSVRLPLLGAKLRYPRIRDIPGSKTILIALAWGVVTTVLPAFYLTGGITVTTLSVFCILASFAFVRTAFFDILDMQGDRIVGKETIAILLGEKRSLRLLKTWLLTVLAVLWVGSALQLFSTLGVALSLAPLGIAAVLWAYEKGKILPGVKLEFLIETHFLLAGLLTWLWSMAGNY